MKILFLLLLQVSLLFSKNVEIDVSRSVVEFQVRHMLFSTTTGHFKNFSGHYEIDDETKTLHSLAGEVLTASVDTKDKSRDEYLKSEAFFDVKKYPKMTLKLLEDGTIQLHIKEVDKVVPFKIVFTDEGFRLKGTISRKAFGLHFSKLAEAGGIAVGDEVTIMIDIVSK